MKVILIEGKPNAGKTTLCKAIEKWIIDQWTTKYKEIRIVREANGRKDFLGMYEIKDAKKVGDKKTNEEDNDDNNFRIIINSASDHPTMINKFYTFYKKHAPCDILITTIRNSSSNIAKVNGKDVDIRKDMEDKLKKITGPTYYNPFIIDLDKSNGFFSLSDVILDIVKN